MASASQVLDAVGISISLRPATAQDIDALAAIADAAFQTDSHTQLKAAFHGAASFREGMREGLRSWLGSPKVDLIVAEDASSAAARQPVGWVGWARRGFPGDVDLPLSSPSDEPKAAGAADDDGTSPRTIKDLERLTNASMEYWACRLMPPGCRCRIVVSCVVRPDYQGKGIGTRLMRWGTDEADRDGVYCWVQSSMGALGAYERFGFREVGRLEVDLDLYAEGRQPGAVYEHVTESRDSWGKYAWIYMRRDAHQG